MTVEELRIQNIALLYSILQELHPGEGIDIAHVATDYDRTVNEVKEYFE